LALSEEGNLISQLGLLHITELMKTPQEVHPPSAGLLLDRSPHFTSPWPFLAPLHLLLFKNLLFPELILHLLLF